MPLSITLTLILTTSSPPLSLANNDDPHQSNRPRLFMADSPSSCKAARPSTPSAVGQTFLQSTLTDFLPTVLGSLCTLSDDSPVASDRRMVHRSRM
ncbi:MAG: hypothetical protein J3Q66DRAFT_357786 [Benniella sp.]|nr:MAG: hypothetical protein J3Q66DRAFT_357786 [Benniella sp.]